MSKLARPGSKSRSDAAASPRYDLVAMGGTFDVLHRGHRRLLKTAFAAGRKVVIGVTNDAFARELHKPHKVDSFESRKRYLKKLLARWKVLGRAKIVQLKDRHGPTASSSKIDALIVSNRTLGTARRINRVRKASGLKPLAIIPIGLVLADDRRPISSTRIRRGRINREGRLVKKV